jgi:S1-C subfamily serine protease/cytochrome c-type biogenesis protein CcmH/NrfG
MSTVIHFLGLLRTKFATHGNTCQDGLQGGIEAFSSKSVADVRVASRPAMWRTATVIFTTLILHIQFQSLAEEFSTEEVAQRSTPSVMLVVCGDSQGTGFMVSENGLLVTNHHVIEGAKKMFVKSNTGGIHEVESVVAVDKDRDLAVLKVGVRNIKPLVLADAPTVNPGAKVVVIGNPQGLESTITEGIVSAKRGLSGYGEVLQITAPISPGSSGSPVFNIKGEVVGIATFKRLDGEALNFAIPSNRIIDLLKTIDQARPELANKGYLPKEVAEGSADQDRALSESTKYSEISAMQDERSFFEMLKTAKQLIEEYPESALAYRLLSQACLGTDLLEDAAENAKKAIDLDPKNPRGWTILSEVFNVMGDTEGVKEVLAHAIKVVPDDAILLIFYARSIRESNDALAVGALKSAFNLLKQGKGNDLESLEYLPDVTLAEDLNLYGPPDLAYEVCQELVKLRSDSPFLLIQKAKSALNAKKYDEVRPTLSKVYQLDPGYANASELHVIIGRLEMAQKNFGAAETAFKNAYKIALENDEPAALGHLCNVYFAVSAKAEFLDEDIATLENCLIESQKFDSDLARQLGSTIRKILQD